jgi:hypothetical protein
MHGKLGPQVELFSALNRLLEQPVILLDIPTGGITLINPANVLEVKLFSEIIELPRDAWVIKAL